MFLVRLVGLKRSRNKHRTVLRIWFWVGYCISSELSLGSSRSYNCFDVIPKEIWMRHKWAEGGLNLDFWKFQISIGLCFFISIVFIYVLCHEKSIRPQNRALTRNGRLYATDQFRKRSRAAIASDSYFRGTFSAVGDSNILYHLSKTYYLACRAHK